MVAEGLKGNPVGGRYPPGGITRTFEPEVAFGDRTAGFKSFSLGNAFAFDLIISQPPVVKLTLWDLSVRDYVKQQQMPAENSSSNTTTFYKAIIYARSQLEESGHAETNIGCNIKMSNSLT